MADKNHKQQPMEGGGLRGHHQRFLSRSLIFVNQVASDSSAAAARHYVAGRDNKLPINKQSSSTRLLEGRPFVARRAHQLTTTKTGGQHQNSTSMSELSEQALVQLNNLKLDDSSKQAPVGGAQVAAAAALPLEARTTSAHLQEQQQFGLLANHFDNQQADYSAHNPTMMYNEQQHVMQAYSPAEPEIVHHHFNHQPQQQRHYTFNGYQAPFVTQSHDYLNQVYANHNHNQSIDYVDLDETTRNRRQQQQQQLEVKVERPAGSQLPESVIRLNDQATIGHAHHNQQVHFHSNSNFAPTLEQQAFYSTGGGELDYSRHEQLTSSTSSVRLIQRQAAAAATSHQFASSSINSTCSTSDHYANRRQHEHDHDHDHHQAFSSSVASNQSVQRANFHLRNSSGHHHHQLDQSLGSSSGGHFQGHHHQRHSTGSLIELEPPSDGQEEECEGEDEEEEACEEERLKVCEWFDCGNTFMEMEAFVRHLEECHVNQEPREKNRYFCLWANCKRNNQEFNARYKLLIHMRVHSGEKPYACKQRNCKKAFSRLENLKIHVRSHTGEKPYRCNFQNCSKSFTNSSDRIKHHKTHRDPKPYNCTRDGCQKRYTDPSSLRKHLRAHKRGCGGGIGAPVSPPPPTHLQQEMGGQLIYHPNELAQGQYSIQYGHAADDYASGQHLQQQVNEYMQHPAIAADYDPTRDFESVLGASHASISTTTAHELEEAPAMADFSRLEMVHSNELVEHASNQQSNYAADFQQQPEVRNDYTDLDGAYQRRRLLQVAPETRHLQTPARRLGQQQQQHQMYSRSWCAGGQQQPQATRTRRTRDLVYAPQSSGERRRPLDSKSSQQLWPQQTQVFNYNNSLGDNARWPNQFVSNETHSEGRSKRHRQHEQLMRSMPSDTGRFFAREPLQQQQQPPPRHEDWPPPPPPPQASNYF